MKNIITLFVLVLFTTEVSSQLAVTKSSIIQEHINHKMQITDDGTEYISFEVAFDTYHREVACFLTRKEENKEQICYRVLMIEPSSETNTWIKAFNDQNYIKLEGMIWKDYENSIVYEVNVQEGQCIVVKYYDTKL
jgi:hypothetical protein